MKELSTSLNVDGTWKCTNAGMGRLSISWELTNIKIMQKRRHTLKVLSQISSFVTCWLFYFMYQNILDVFSCLFVKSSKWNLRLRWASLPFNRASPSFRNQLLDITLLIYESAFSNQALFVNLNKSIFDLKLNTRQAAPNPIHYLRDRANQESNNCHSDTRANLLLKFSLYPISNDIYRQKIQLLSQIKVHQSFRTQYDPWIWYSKSVIEDLIRE